MKRLINFARLANPAFWYFLTAMIGCAALFIYLGGLGHVAEYLQVVVDFMMGR